MQTERIDDFEVLEQKTSQLEISNRKSQSDNNNSTGYLFFCSLCDEALVLSRRQVNPRKIQFAFDGNCPGCSFELEKVLDCRTSYLPLEKKLRINVKCKDPSLLFETLDEENNNNFQQSKNSSFLPRDGLAHLTSGISPIDKVLVLKRGQFISFLGSQAHSFSLLYLVRAILPFPQGGLDGDVVFVDGGNIFDTYTVSQHATSYELDSRVVQERIHLSRAFTHHQLHNLIVEKLSDAIDSYKAKLTIISDITLLFNDPDVRNKKESGDLFRKSLHHLAMVAEQTNSIIITTNLQNRNQLMEGMLLRIPHVSTLFVDHGAYTQLLVKRHPFLPEKDEEVVLLENQTLTGYLT
jgi:hypothetical protein